MFEAFSVPCIAKGENGEEKTFSLMARETWSPIPAAGIPSKRSCPLTVNIHEARALTLQIQILKTNAAESCCIEAVSSGSSLV